MRIDGSKLAVIGGAGLIGSHTVDGLLNEDVSEIVVFDNFAEGTNQNLDSASVDARVRMVDGDIGNPETLRETLEEVDGVFHFATLSLLHCHDHPREGFDVNLTGTFNVLEACRDAGVRRLVFSSSASVYGDALEEPITELHPFNNGTFYGATKIAGEAMAHAFYHRSGLEYVSLRYFNVYGPRQGYKGEYVSVIMKILNCLDRGEAPKVYGDGSQAFDFVSVKDCARANVEAMRADAVGRAYNVCTGIGTSIRELAGILIGLSGREVEIDYRLEEGSSVTSLVGDPTRACEDLKFVAQTGLVDGLRELIEWRDRHRRRRGEVQ